MILGASILQMPAIEKAKEMGLEVIAVDMDPNAVGFQKADIPLLISTIDIPTTVLAAKEYQIDGIMTLASDMPMRTVAAVAKELHLVGIDEDTALKTTNKAVMRQCLKDHNVPIPEFYKVNSLEDYKEAIRHFNSKIIVKPADNSGSRGVVCINNISEVEYAFYYSKQYSRDGSIIVEEYMCGNEVSVETISIDGECHVIQITDKLTTGAPHFVEMGHSQPTVHSKETVMKIKNIAVAAVNAVGIKYGPSHTEIMITNTGPKIVEIGARLGGDCITTHLVPYSTGIDLVECCIRLAIGENVDINAKFHKGTAIRYFNSHEGTLKRISGIEEARKLQHVKQLCFLRQVGETINDIASSADRIGFVITQADDVQNAVSVCEQAKKYIHIEID